MYGTLEETELVRPKSAENKDELSVQTDADSTPVDETPRNESFGTEEMPVQKSAGSPPRRTTETELVRATLVGLPRVPIYDFVYDHRLDSSHDPDETRAIALFDIENTWDQPLLWQSARTRFFGDDDYTYQTSHMELDPSRLGPGCHSRQVEIPPGRRARMATLAEELPAGVDVAKVVHTLSPSSADKQRLHFSVK